MYVLKTKGTDKIPDYIQIRDDAFALLTHFKYNSAESNLRKLGFDKEIKNLIKIIEKVKYGELIKVNNKII